MLAICSFPTATVKSKWILLTYMRGHLDAWSNGLGNIPLGQHLVYYDVILSDATIDVGFETKHFRKLQAIQYNTKNETSFCLF